MSRLLVLALFAVGLVACGHQLPPIQPRNLLVVPLTFEINLITSRECEVRGAVPSLFEAVARGGNLAVVFSATQMTSNYNGVVTTTMGPIRAKAALCPPAALAKVQAWADAIAREPRP